MGSLFRKSEEAYIKEGSQLLLSGQLGPARSVLEKGLSKYPESWSLRSNLANVFLTAQQFDVAAKLLTEGLERIPQGHNAEWALRLERGACYLRLDEGQAALQDLDAALQGPEGDKPKPFLAKGYFYRALIHMDTDTGKALEDAKEAVRLDPSDGTYGKLVRDLISQQASPMTPEIAELGQLGAEHLQRGNPTDALECFNKLLEIEPKHAKGLQLKGAALHKLQRYEEELEALKASYEPNQNEVALFNLGPCCLALGDAESARKYLEEFVKVGTHAASVNNAKAILSRL